MNSLASNVVLRWIQRIGTGIIAIIAIWIIVTQIFQPLHERLPLFFALLATYIISAYIVLPIIVHIGLTILRRGRIPRVTRTPDGLPADPINILLIGSELSLLDAFAKAGWKEADKLTLGTAFKMFIAFGLNKPYPTAPFRSFFLFGRRQDHGFQIEIGDSPRKRHHIRFWAANIDPEIDLGNFAYWTKKHDIDPKKAHIWVGAGTLDLGVGLSSLTYQITHRQDKDIDKERDFIIESLRSANIVADERYVDSGSNVVGKFFSDGKILAADLLQNAD